MEKQLSNEIKVLMLLSNGSIGLRKIHKEATFPQIVEHLKDYRSVRNNIVPKEVELETWNGHKGWSCPSCGQWCYEEHNYNYCGRCGQKFLHEEK
jgi:rubrerythrin